MPKIAEVQPSLKYEVHDLLAEAIEIRQLIGRNNAGKDGIEKHDGERDAMRRTSSRPVLAFLRPVRARVGMLVSVLGEAASATAF